MSSNISKLLNKPIGFYVALLLFLIIVLYKPKKTEHFLSPGEYPRDMMNPLLYEDYPLKKKHYKQVSANNYSTNYPLYPTFSADSVENNNIRYWKTPDNGLCSTAEFCDVLYDNRPLPDSKLYTPQPEWGQQRVNYYVSEEREE